MGDAVMSIDVSRDRGLVPSLTELIFSLRVAMSLRGCSAPSSPQTAGAVRRGVYRIRSSEAVCQTRLGRPAKSERANRLNRTAFAGL